MDWADDTAYSLNDLADSVQAGFLTTEKIQGWAERREVPTGEGTPLGDLLRAVRLGPARPLPFSHECQQPHHT